MIHKFLYIAKQVSISSTKIEDENGNNFIIDLMLPIETYWQVLDLLKKADFLIASDEHMADVHEIYKKIFKKTAHWAVFETDRMWLHANSAANANYLAHSSAAAAAASSASQDNPPKAS